MGSTHLHTGSGYPAQPGLHCLGVGESHVRVASQGWEQWGSGARGGCGVDGSRAWGQVGGEEVRGEECRVRRGWSGKVGWGRGALGACRLRGDTSSACCHWLQVPTLALPRSLPEPAPSVRRCKRRRGQPSLPCRAIWARSATAVGWEPAGRTRWLLHLGLQCPAGPKLLLAVSGARFLAWTPCRGRRTAKVSRGAGGWGVQRKVLLRDRAWTPGARPRCPP